MIMIISLNDTIAIRYIILGLFCQARICFQKQLVLGWRSGHCEATGRSGLARFLANGRIELPIVAKAAKN
jgi:hypothetical protein